MSKNKRIKTISFNITNKDDVKILDKISKMDNFSGYVKRLILEDIRKEQTKVVQSGKGGIKIVLG